MPRGDPHFDPPPDAVRSTLVRPVRVDVAGESGPTPEQVRTKRWRRTSQGFYVPSSVDGSETQQRVVEAAVMLPESGAVLGWAALAWLGARWFSGVSGTGELLPVPLWIGNHQVRQQSGVVVTAERFVPSDRMVVDGIAIVAPAVSVAYEMRYATSLSRAVRIVDMAAYDDLVTIAEVADLLDELNGWTGIPRAREAIALADENAWSPTETELRLLIEVELGRPRPLINRPVFDLRGRFIGTPDLLDVEAGVAIEYDGALHLAGEQRTVDLRREAAFRQIGLEYVTMVAGDRGDPALFVRRYLEARARGLAHAAEQRGWTLEPPPGWVPAHTVAQRRALTADQRERFLRRRAG